MNKRFLVIALCIYICMTTLGTQPPLRDIFLNPPSDARPRGYWLWCQGNYDYTRLKEELRKFQEVGLAGVDIFDFGVDDRTNVIPDGPRFFSPEHLDGLEFAFKEGKRLGLKMGFSAVNGWNVGADWTPEEQKSMNLLIWCDTVHGPLTVEKVGFPNVPAVFKKQYGQYPLYPRLDSHNRPVYYRDVALLAYPHTRDKAIQSFDQIRIFDPATIRNDSVTLNLPQGQWVVMRAVVAPTGQKLWASGRRYNGFIMDHFSPEATHDHFNYVVRELENRLGAPLGNTLERLYLCSFESEAQIEWSPGLPDHFYQLNGYNIDPFLPTLMGQTVIDEETTSQFLHDYRRTISDMFIRNHYLQLRKKAHAHGLLVASESGGPGYPLHRVPTEDYLALEAVDVMRGEFWNNDTQAHADKRGGDLLSVIKNIAGAAHVYGRKVVEMEAFTSHGKHWRETPLELKRLADYAFCNGMTRVIYHTMPHSPKEAGKPGWSYSAGTHYSPQVIWWSLSKPLNDYFARISALLQQGHFVADVAYFKTEEVPNFSIGYKYKHEGLSRGYEYDDINYDALLRATGVENGKIVLASGMRYSVLVLPPNCIRMSVEVALKIEELIRNGATVIGNKPYRVYGLKDKKEREKRLAQISDRIWGKAPKKKQIRKIGLGQIYSGYSENEVLEQLNIVEDMHYASSLPNGSIDFIHRRTKNEDIYFIHSRDSLPQTIHVTFRATGTPQLWNPKDESMKYIGLYTIDKGCTTIPIRLDKYESTIVVFSDTSLKTPFATELKANSLCLFPSNGTVKPLDATVTIDAEKQILSLETEKPATYSVRRSDGASCSWYINEQHEILLNKSWDIRFEYGWGFNPIQKTTNLFDWTTSINKGLASYSGLATYKTTFTIAEGDLNEDSVYELRMGEVADVARVFLNGKEIGTSLWAPHTLQLRGILREGENHIAIEVGNTWNNKLIAELSQGKKSDKLNSNAQRTWTSLKPSSAGLIGPVKIVSYSTSFNIEHK